MGHLPRLVLLLLATGCGRPGIDDSPADTGPGTSDTEDTGDTQDTQDTDTAQPVDTAGWVPSECDPPMADLPVQSTVLRGYTQAEDFAFDAEGYLVSIDERGNLVGIDQSGGRKVILPAAGEMTSGMHMLPDGSFVFSDAWSGTLWRAWPSGASEALLSGLAYPNGVEVDRAGFVYLTEHDASRVRRINPNTGHMQIIAEGIHNANGLQFSTDYQTLYVGSFGGGMVHAVHRSPR